MKKTHPASRSIRQLLPQRLVQRLRFARDCSSAKRGLILAYHRVTEISPDPWLLGVSQSHFAEHLEVLAAGYRTVGLDALTVLLEEDLPDRSVAVTFDDGYADNLHNVKPLLERYGIPATFCLTSGYLGQPREFWWDYLEKVLLLPGVIPPKLRLTVNGRDHQWDLGEHAHYTEGDAGRHRDWNAWLEPPTSRHAVYRSLYQLLQQLSDSERRRTLHELLSWADLGPDCRPTHRCLSFGELSSLARDELVEVGAHSVTHSSLAVLSAAAQRSEIDGSKTQLEALTGRPVRAFAYPFGGPRSYTAETIRIVREAGFASACSTMSGTVGLSTDRFQLPRFQVRNWDGEEFAKRLSGWFGG